MQSPIRERLPWGHETGARFYGLAGTRGQTAPRLAEYIVLAEFDIDSGRSVQLTLLPAVTHVDVWCIVAVIDFGSWEIESYGIYVLQHRCTVSITSLVARSLLPVLLDVSVLSFEQV